MQDACIVAGPEILLYAVCFTSNHEGEHAQKKKPHFLGWGTLAVAESGALRGCLTQTDTPTSEFHRCCLPRRYGDLNEGLASVTRLPLNETLDSSPGTRLPSCITQCAQIPIADDREGGGHSQGCFGCCWPTLAKC